MIHDFLYGMTALAKTTAATSRGCSSWRMAFD
jgi:hypothetical protein